MVRFGWYDVVASTFPPFLQNIQDECEVIADSSERVVQGAKLKALALDLRKRGVPTVTGAKWSAATLRDILLRPRNAGLMVYQGEEIGAAPWKEIVPLDTFRAVQRILTDPDRRQGPGAAPKWWAGKRHREV